MKKEHKGLKIIGNILYAILFVIAILMLTVVALQRVSDNSLSLGGYRIFIVATGSMEPKYLVSDVLLAKEISPSEINVGDDVVYKGKEGTFKGRVVTHQVIEKSQEDGTYKFITKGIANLEADPQITGNQIYGKVICKIKTLSYIGKVIQNMYIFYFFIFIPIGIIIYKQIRNIVYDLTHKEDNDDE
ncbi:MAG: signal peptidase I [Clostridia bacterium]|nr:signal peptidase I [Clostridia bacterium]